MKTLAWLPIALLAAAPAMASAAESRVAGEPVPALRARVLELMNQARAQGRRCGRESFPPAAPLGVAKPLQQAAQDHARDMARRKYFSHEAPGGSKARDRVMRAGYRLRLVGENIAFGPDSAEEVVAGWLDSPGHCANIMDARFRETGIGVAEGRERGHIYWVQTLGWPADTAR